MKKEEKTPECAVKAANMVERFRKLLRFLGEDEFAMPKLQSREKVHQCLMEEFPKHAVGADGKPTNDPVIMERVRAKNPIDTADIVDARVTAKNPSVIHVYTANESHHNGSEYGAERAEIPMFPAFMELAMSILANRVHNKIDADMKSEETEERRKKIEARMTKMGLL